MDESDESEDESDESMEETDESMEESSKNNDVTELVDKAVIVELLAPLTVVTLLLLLLMIEAIDEK